MPICQGFDQYANVRPTRMLPGITSPLRNVEGKAFDWVIVRENSEGEYTVCGGRMKRGQAAEVAIQSAIHTRQGIERILRFGFELCDALPEVLPVNLNLLKLRVDRG